MQRLKKRNQKMRYFEIRFTIIFNVNFEKLVSRENKILSINTRKSISKNNYYFKMIKKFEIELRDDS